MATTLREAGDIVDIIYRHIQPSKALLMLTELEKEVGQKTTNESLRLTLAMLLGEITVRQ